MSPLTSLKYPTSLRSPSPSPLLSNDDGALLVEARVMAELADILRNPIPSEFNKLLLLELDVVPESSLGIQLNLFNFGGVAVGICVSYWLADALTSLVFIQSWMSIARGQNDTVFHPGFVSRDLFPPVDIARYLPLILINYMCTTYEKKRFVFQSSMIESLRPKYNERTSQEAECRLSHIEVLSSFIWSRFIDEMKLVESGLPVKEYTILHAVNIRPKFDLPYIEKN